MRLLQEWRMDPARGGATLPVCADCSAWLGGLAGRAADPAEPSPFGSPDPGVRRRRFEDQCAVCYEMPTGRGAMLTWVSPQGSHVDLFACTGCEAWLSSLAADGRTVRGRGDRQIDGPYGSWPHPNLRGRTVEADMLAGGVAEVIERTTTAMGMTLVRHGDAPDVLFVEAEPNGRAASRVRDSLRETRGIIVLAGLRTRRDLAAALGLGARTWLTLPSTPQQLTAAIIRALQPGPGAPWDPQTCLPVVADASPGRDSVIVCTPEEGADAFEVSWLLRRFSRGYDELSVCDGRIVLRPRTSADEVHSVVARLRPLLDGRCAFAVVNGAEAPRARRFEAAG